MGVLPYNLIKKKHEFIVESLPILEDNRDNAILNYIKSLANLYGMRSSDVLRFAETLCLANEYNPVPDWIVSKPWDGVDRLPVIYDMLKVDVDFPDQLKKAIIKRWLLSAVAAACTAEEFRARGLLTLQGKQGLGKTQWFARLANDLPTGERYVLLGQYLDIANKDDVLTSIQHWIVKLGELDSTFRKDIAGLKAFIAKDCDQVRKSYDRADSVFPRRTVYGGSVNSSYFLVDPTGNSRFWTLPVVSIDYEHNVNMQQLFAQLYLTFQQGEQWWLTQEGETLLDEQNRNHIATSPIQELVRGAVDIDRIDEDGLPAFGAGELLRKLDIKEPQIKHPSA
jgi:predicted P-loop ATPase